MKKRDTEDRRMNENSKMTDREIAETLLPDMCTVPMTDEEIERFMRS